MIWVIVGRLELHIFNGGRIKPYLLRSGGGMVDAKPQQEGWNAVTDSEVQGVEGEDYAWL